MPGHKHLLGGGHVCPYCFVFSIYCVGLRGQTQSIRLGNKSTLSLNLITHSPNPLINSFILAMLEIEPNDLVTLYHLTTFSVLFLFFETGSC